MQASQFDNKIMAAWSQCVPIALHSSLGFPPTQNLFRQRRFSNTRQILTDDAH